LSEIIEEIKDKKDGADFSKNFNQEHCIQIAQRYIEKAAAQQGGEEVTFKEFKRFTNQVVKGIGAEIEKEKLSKVFEEMAMEDSDLLAKEEFGENIFKILQ